jgi:hypothetical protein
MRRAAFLGLTAGVTAHIVRSSGDQSQENGMRAIVCEELGGPERLVLREVPSPPPAPGEVKVALHARGVSFVDVPPRPRPITSSSRMRR